MSLFYDDLNYLTHTLALDSSILSLIGIGTLSNNFNNSSFSSCQHIYNIVENLKFAIFQFHEKTLMMTNVLVVVMYSIVYI